MNILELAILKKMVGGGGGSGTDNYNDLSNLPQINGETLAGNKTAENLGLQDALTFDSAPTEDSTNPVESGGVYNALAGKQDNLTFDDDPTENSTNPVKSGGVYSALAGKQDNLTFDGVYNASTNKAATESTVTNAIAGLDVSAFSVDADETISSISETDGKINVTKQDIAIASNQVTAMTGYTKPSSAPATPAIQTSDTANQAFGKLEFKADTNQTNILLVQDATKELVDEGGKNIVKLYEVSEFTNIPSSLTVTKNSDGSLTLNGSVSSALYSRIGKVSGNATGYSMYVSTVVSDNTTIGFFYTSDNHLDSIGGVRKWHNYTSEWSTDLFLYVAANSTLNNVTLYPMICLKSKYDVSPNYEPPALPNYDLTVREAEDRAALIECVDEGAKNLLPRIINSGLYIQDNVTFTVNSDGSVTVNSTGAVSDSVFINYYNGKMSDIIPSDGVYKLFASDGDGNAQVKVWWAYTDTWTVVSETSNSTNTTVISESDLNRPITVRVVVFTGAAISNAKVYPMVCTKAKLDVSKNYAPYRKNLDQLEATKAPALDTGAGVDSGSLDDISENTFAIYTTNVLNLPTATSYYYVETSVFNSSNALQRAYGTGNGESYVRVKYQGIWSAWKQITNT